MVESVLRFVTELDLHPRYRNSRYSLRGIFLDHERARNRAEALASQGYTLLWFEDTAPDGRQFHGIGAQLRTRSTTRARLPHQHDVPWDATRLALKVFRTGMRRGRDSGWSVRWYKPLDERRLRDTLSSLDWRGTRLEVAANMISDLIISHPFPNANHRTALQIGRSYLQTKGISWPRYSLRGRGIQRFMDDCSGFIAISKYHLQLRRRPRLARIAWDLGFRTFRFSPRLTHPLRDADLQFDKRVLRENHRQHCRQLIWNLSTDRAQDGLRVPNKGALREFVRFPR